MLLFMCKVLRDLHEQSLRFLCWHACVFMQSLHAVSATDVNTFTQVKKTLGWEPVVPLKEGLALMVEDFARRLGQCTASLLHTLSNTPILWLWLNSMNVCKRLMSGRAGEQLDMRWATWALCTAICIDFATSCIAWLSAILLCGAGVPVKKSPKESLPA